MKSLITNSLTKYIISIVNKSQDNNQIKIPGKEYTVEILFETLCELDKKLSGTAVIKISKQYYSLFPKELKLNIENNHQDWIDETGNLTTYRNEFASSNKNNKSVLIIVGFDYVDDQSSLAHFLSADLKCLFKRGMRGSFKTWLEEITPGEDSSTSDVLLRVVSDYVDLVTLDSFLSKITLDNEDLFSSIGSNLWQIGIPCFYSKTDRNEKKISESIRECLERVKGVHNLEKNNIVKSRNIIEELQAALVDPETNDNKELKYLLNNPDMYPYHENLEDLLSDCVRLTDSDCPDEVKERILKTDSFSIIYKIFKYKKKTDKKSSTDEKVEGLPLEAVITALWHFFEEIYSSQEKGAGFPHLSLLRIQPNKILHNLELGNIPDTTDQSFVFSNIIIPLLGGVDDILNDFIFPSMINNESDLFEDCDMESMLTTEITDVTKTNNTPYLIFQISAEDEFGVQYLKKFKYEYRNDSPIVYSVELVKNAIEACKSLSSVCLPVFCISKYVELYDKTDDEVPLFFSSEVSRPDSLVCYNLASSLEKGSEVAKEVDLLYAHFLTFCNSVGEKGLYSAVLNESSNFCNQYCELLNNMSNVENSSQYSSFRSSLIRSFWIIEDVPKNQNEYEFLSSSDFGNGIITVLHPAMLDMLNAQVHYLATSFATTFFEALADNRLNKTEGDAILSQLLDFASLNSPIPFMPQNDSKVLASKGNDLLYMLGQPEKDESIRPASIICRSEEEIKSSMVTTKSQESSLIYRMLEDYYNTYMIARYSLDLSVVLAPDVQPVISAILQFLEFYNSRNKMHQRYTVNVSFFVSPSEERNVSRWIGILEDYIQSNNQKQTSKYASTKVNLYCKTLPVHSEAIISYFKEISYDADISILYESDDLIKEDVILSRLKKIEATDSIVKFPLAKKLLPKKVANGSFYDAKKRTSLISNRQFNIYTTYMNYIASLRNQIDNKYDIAIEKSVDFSNWNGILNYCVNTSERVIAIGNDLDKSLCYGACGKDSTIIGCGSGIGKNADLNYVAVSKMVSYEKLKERLTKKFRSKFISVKNVDKVMKNLILASEKMSDLSLIKTISCRNLYCHDFFGYSMIRHLLKAKEGAFTDVLLSLDSYKHWFRYDDKRADLLWVRAYLKTKDDNPYFSIEFSVIESKLGADVKEHLLSHAALQASETYDYLRSRFNDKSQRYDSKYWWMQLHRIISANSVIESDEKDPLVRNALEKLAGGHFEINSFDHCVIAFETTNIYGDQPYVVFQSETHNVNEIVFTSNGIEKYMVSPMDVEWGEFYSYCISNISDVVDDSNEQAYVQRREEEKEIEEELNHEVSFYSSEESSEMDEFEDSKSDSYVIKPESSENSSSSNNSNENTEIVSDNYKGKTVDYLSEDSEEKEDGIENKDYHEAENNGCSESEKQPLKKGVPLYAPSDASILLGRDKAGVECKWYFGEDYKGAENKHLLILGGSGSGKSYAIKCILSELARQNQSSLIIDYTNGFTEAKLAEDETSINSFSLNKFIRPQYRVANKPLPLNPMARATYPDKYSETGYSTEKTYAAASRAADTISYGFSLGKVQESLLEEVIEKGIDESLDNGTSFTMKDLGEKLEEFANKKGPNKASYLGLAAQVKPLYKSEIFGDQNENESIWDIVSNSDGTEKTVSVFQFYMVSPTPTYIAVDLILRDLWNYAIQRQTTESTPHVIVLDEFQNLSLKNDSPVRKILQEGRKMGLNLVLATQTLSGIKNKDGQDALSSIFNAANILFFKPTVPETKAFGEYANNLDKSKSVESWTNIISGLHKGECIVFTRDEKGSMKGKKIKITSFEER